MLDPEVAEEEGGRVRQTFNEETLDVLVRNNAKILSSTRDFQGCGKDEHHFRTAGNRVRRSSTTLVCGQRSDVEQIQRR